ncbi:U32 family peptidase [Evtepia sp.]|uniref:U32 family peptidase n=1 Tax=Evtepia sp. TaxID=2773933 RepID=UPI002A811A89|nr:DUF3656 domain-containing protein [Evtepia sp.]MDY4431370.1 DUF3656 domain-containing protein [Evtepia sp.]
MELLAPAGSPEALTAAVQAGADAVYLGCGPLNARRNAKNFSLEDLARGVEYCHLRGTKVYLTLNTLLSDRELPLAAETAAFASHAGVDAILVQDLGVARLLRDTVPDVDLHASTQMTVHDLDGIKACADLGMTRVVLSRELSRSAIENLCAKSPVEIEIFVHGALCMCYSGQCFLSAVLGGRSGNRGLCAQPCRLAFRWPGDKGNSHPLSLKDMSLAGELRELEKMGVACLKIEGRMKRPEYVSVVTGIYAAALRENREPTRQELAELEAAFSRQGFTQGYYNDQKGPAMFGTRPEGTKDPATLFEKARQTYSRGEHKLTPVWFAAQVKKDQPLSVTAWDEAGHTARAQGSVPEAARSRAVTEEQIQTQLAKTGGTVYAAQTVEAEVEPGLSVPMSALNALRREVLAGLDEARTALPSRRTLPFTPPERVRGRENPPVFSLSFRRWAQVSREILDQDPALVYLPCDEIAAHEEEVAALVRDYPAVSFGTVLPRVAWDRERPRLEQELAAAQRAGVQSALLGHMGQLSLARDYGLIPRGDFGLGLTNSLTAGELARLGFASAAVSFESKLAQIRDLSKPLDTELLVYGRLPLMLTENCIMKNRGKGCHCEESPQSLRDRKGEDFPVEKAWGCRNELFNAKILWLADKKADWQRTGVTYARLSFLRESAKTCAQVFAAYRTGRGDAPEGFTRGLYYRGVE